MFIRSPLPSFLVVALLGAAAASAQERVLAPRPAVAVQGKTQAIDPKHFIVQPPASTTWQRAHSHADHPAVQVARNKPVARIDSNTFTVQPPAHVTWTLGPAAEPAAQMAYSGLLLK